MPPLRERREDIPLLVAHFIEKFNKEYNKQMSGISPDALRLLNAYDWPRNVGELRTTIHEAVAMCDEEIINVNDLPEKIRNPVYSSTPQPHDVERPEIPIEKDNLIKDDRDLREKLIKNVKEKITDNFQKNFDSLSETQKALLGLIFKKVREEKNPNEIKNELIREWSGYERTTCSTALTTLVEKGFLEVVANMKRHADTSYKLKDVFVN